MGVPVFWIQGIPEEKRADFVSSVLSSPVTRKLREYLHNRLSSLELREEKNLYDNPSWSHKQAHINGNREIVKELLLLLSFDPQGN